MEITEREDRTFHAEIILRLNKRQRARIRKEFFPRKHDLPQEQYIYG